MKAVLISIQPKWCELIAAGKKTVEVRKTKPTLETPFKCYIYQTRKTWVYDIYSRIADWQGKVIGEFVCDKIITAQPGKYCKIPLAAAQLDAYELMDYADEKTVYGWCISNFVIYDNPKELCEFHRKCEEFRCEGCEHLKYQRVNASEYDYDCEYFNYLIPIARPPQSWCYVESLGEG